MKLRSAFFLTTLLALSACSGQDIVSSSSSSSSSSSIAEKTIIEKFKVRTLNSRVSDANFKNGFEQMSPYTTDAHVDGVLDYNGSRETDHYDPESENKTYWQMCQWWTPFNFIDSEYSKVGNIHHYENESRIMEVDTETGSLKMELNSGIEYDELYGGKLPQDKSWSHFLIQQKFPEELYVRIADFDEIRVKMDITIHKADYVGKEPIALNRECAQLLFYFNIAEADEEYKPLGNKMWFGVPIFDSRSDSVSEYHAIDSGFEGATNTLIHSMASNSYMGSGPVVMGKKYSLDIDVKQYIQEAFVRAVNEGVFKDANWNRFFIHYLNFGWELPGEYDVSCTLENFDVITIKY